MMETPESISSLRKSTQRVGDSGLKNDILGRVGKVEGEFLAVRAQLRDKQCEIDDLQGRLSERGNAAQLPDDFVYDPPV